MKINLSGHSFATSLISVLPEHFSLTEGTAVRLSHRDTCGYAVSLIGGVATITSSDVSAMMLAFSDLLAGKIKNNVEILMPFRALMLDASRNGVPKVSFLKPTIARLALLGMNHFCLYTEDTFQVDDEPLIGFGRGAYSKDEIRDLVTFSASIGVTMFPCFQTLGHLEQILKYEKYEYLHDNHRVLNTTIDETYTFIEKLIDNVREPYDTNLIHLGMDEPWGIGRGKSFAESNPQKPSQMYVEHVTKLTALCHDKGLESIIWGDYVLGHPDQNTSADDGLDDDAIKGLPQNVILDYWNYFDVEKQPYTRDITTFQNMGYDLVASPGLQTWNNFWGQLELCQNVSTPFIQASQEQGIDRAMMTIWGDDGHECLFHNNWAALAQFFALTIGDHSQEQWKDRLETISGVPYHNFSLISKIENPDISQVGKILFTPTAKMLFYDDPLLGFVNQMFSDDSVCVYYDKLLIELQQLECNTSEEQDRCELAILFSTIISRKFHLIQSARKHYISGDKANLRKQIGGCEDLVHFLKQFSINYRNAWMTERKPFGYEVLDNRFGGMIARVNTLKDCIENYLNGSLAEISELEQESCADLTYKDLQFYPKITTKCFSIW